MPSEGSAVEEVQGVGSTVAGTVSGMSAQRAAGPYSVGDGGTMTGVGGQDFGHVCCATLLLTLSDSRALR